MTDSEFHDRADALLRRLETQVDAWLQDDVIDIDPQRSGGLLELSLPDRSKLVVNKQAPLHEVWFASKAAAFHFQWRDEAWCDTKTGARFEDVFAEQASLQAGRRLALTA